VPRNTLKLIVKVLVQAILCIVVQKFLQRVPRRQKQIDFVPFLSPPAVCHAVSVDGVDVQQVGIKAGVVEKEEIIFCIKEKGGEKCLRRPSVRIHSSG